MKALDQEIARLTNFANNAAADVADKYFVVIHNLQAKRDKAAKMLRQLHSGCDKVWMREDAATGVEDAWNELRDAVLAAITTTYCEASRRPTERHRLEGPHRLNRIRRIAPRGSCY